MYDQTDLQPRTLQSSNAIVKEEDMTMKRVLIVLLTIVILLGAGSSAKTKNYDKTFNAAMTASPTSLDEGYSTNAHCRQVSPFIFETLFTFDDAYEVIPQLAESYTMSDDRLIYNIFLRQGILFHDGSSFNAEDVIASIERYKNTITYGGSLDAIASTEIISDYEIRVSLSEPIALIPALAFPQRVLMLPSEIAKKNMESELRGADIIGSGPYKLAEWTPDVQIVLERFDEYVPDERYENATGFGGKRIAYFKTIKLIPVTEAESRMAGLETGEFDFAESIPATSYDRIARNPNLTASIVCPKWSIFLEINHKQWPTNDVNFRKALVYALDMEKVLKAVTSDNDMFYRLSPSLYQEEQYYFTKAGSEGIYNCRNLGKVAELLKAAGYKGEEIICLTNKNFDWMYKSSLSLAEQWQKAGINVKLEFSDWSSQIAKANSLEGWSINQTGMSTRLDPTQLRSNLASGSVSAYAYSNPQMDALLKEIGMGNTNEARYKIWERIQGLVWEDVPVIKIGDYHEMEAISSKYDGYKSFFLPRFWNVTER